MIDTNEDPHQEVMHTNTVADHDDTRGDDECSTLTDDNASRSSMLSEVRQNVTSVLVQVRFSPNSRVTLHV